MPRGSLLPLTLCLSVSLVPSSGVAQEVSDAEAIGLYVGAALTLIAVHETGHALAAASLGWDIQKFAPYPHICGGRLVGGCVVSSSDEEAGSPEARSESIWVSAAGSLTSTVAALALAPLIPRIENPHVKYYMERTVFNLRIDFPYYVALDILGFGGDWRSVADNLDVPVWWLVPMAALHWYGMDRYVRAVTR